MDTTTGIAIYGAGLSTAIAGSRFITWLRERQVRLRIVVEEDYRRNRESLPANRHQLFGWKEGLARVVLNITVFNDGERTERINRLWVEESSGEVVGEGHAGGGGFVMPRQRATFRAAEPEILNGRETATFEIGLLHDSYRVGIELGDGKRIYGPVLPEPTNRDRYLAQP